MTSLRKLRMKRSPQPGKYFCVLLLFILFCVCVFLVSALLLESVTQKLTSTPFCFLWAPRCWSNSHQGGMKNTKTGLPVKLLNSAADVWLKRLKLYSRSVCVHVKSLKTHAYTKNMHVVHGFPMCASAVNHCSETAEHLFTLWPLKRPALHPEQSTGWTQLKRASGKI